MESTQVLECTQVLDSFSIIGETQDRPVKVGKLTIDGIDHSIWNKENSIGRDCKCDVVIDSKAVSVEHAMIEADIRGGHFIWDLGSTNKTKLGDMLLKPRVKYYLNDGCILRIANVKAVYHHLNEQVPSNCSTEPIYDVIEIPGTPERKEEENPLVSIIGETPCKSDEGNEADGSDGDLFGETSDVSALFMKPVGLTSIENSCQSLGVKIDDSGGDEETINDKEPHSTSRVQSIIENVALITEKGFATVDESSLCETDTSDYVAGSQPMFTPVKNVVNIYDIDTEPPEAIDFQEARSGPQGPGNGQWDDIDDSLSEISNQMDTIDSLVEQDCLKVTYTPPKRMPFDNKTGVNGVPQKSLSQSDANQPQSPEAPISCSKTLKKLFIEKVEEGLQGEDNPSNSKLEDKSVDNLQGLYDCETQQFVVESFQGLNSEEMKENSLETSAVHPNNVLETSIFDLETQPMNALEVSKVDIGSHDPNETHTNSPGDVFKLPAPSQKLEAPKTVDVSISDLPTQTVSCTDNFRSLEALQNEKLDVVDVSISDLATQANPSLESDKVVPMTKLSSNTKERGISLSNSAIHATAFGFKSCTPTKKLSDELQNDDDSVFDVETQGAPHPMSGSAVKESVDIAKTAAIDCILIPPNDQSAKTDKVNPNLGPVESNVADSLTCQIVELQTSSKDCDDSVFDLETQVMPETAKNTDSVHSKPEDPVDASDLIMTKMEKSDDAESGDVSIFSLATQLKPEDGVNIDKNPDSNEADCSVTQNDKVVPSSGLPQTSETCDISVFDLATQVVEISKTDSDDASKFIKPKVPSPLIEEVGENKDALDNSCDVSFSDLPTQTLSRSLRKITEPLTPSCKSDKLNANVSISDLLTQKTSTIDGNEAERQGKEQSEDIYDVMTQQLPTKTGQTEETDIYDIQTQAPMSGHDKDIPVHTVPDIYSMDTDPLTPCAQKSSDAPHEELESSISNLPTEDVAHMGPLCTAKKPLDADEKHDLNSSEICTQTLETRIGALGHNNINTQPLSGYQDSSNGKPSVADLLETLEGSQSPFIRARKIAKPISYSDSEEYDSPLLVIKKNCRPLPDSDDESETVQNETNAPESHPKINDKELNSIEASKTTGASNASSKNLETSHEIPKNIDSGLSADQSGRNLSFKLEISSEIPLNKQAASNDDTAIEEENVAVECAASKIINQPLEISSDAPPSTECSKKVPRQVISSAGVESNKGPVAMKDNGCHQPVDSKDSKSIGVSEKTTGASTVLEKNLEPSSFIPKNIDSAPSANGSEHCLSSKLDISSKSLSTKQAAEKQKQRTKNNVAAALPLNTAVSQPLKVSSEAPPSIDSLEKVSENVIANAGVNLSDGQNQGLSAVINKGKAHKSDQPIDGNKFNSGETSKKTTDASSVLSKSSESTNKVKSKPSNDSAHDLSFKLELSSGSSLSKPEVTKTCPIPEKNNRNEKEKSPELVFMRKSSDGLFPDKPVRQYTNTKRFSFNSSSMLRDPSASSTPLSEKDSYSWVDMEETLSTGLNYRSRLRSSPAKDLASKPSIPQSTSKNAKKFKKSSLVEQRTTSIIECDPNEPFRNDSNSQDKDLTESQESCDSQGLGRGMRHKVKKNLFDPVQTLSPAKSSLHPFRRAAKTSEAPSPTRQSKKDLLDDLPSQISQPQAAGKLTEMSTPSETGEKCDRLKSQPIDEGRSSGTSQIQTKVARGKGSTRYSSDSSSSIIESGDAQPQAEISKNNKKTTRSSAKTTSERLPEPQVSPKVRASKRKINAEENDNEPEAKKPAKDIFDSGIQASYSKFALKDVRVNITPVDIPQSPETSPEKETSPSSRRKGGNKTVVLSNTLKRRRQNVEEQISDDSGKLMPTAHSPSKQTAPSLGSVAVKTEVEFTSPAPNKRRKAAASKLFEEAPKQDNEDSKSSGRGKKCRSNKLVENEQILSKVNSTEAAKAGTRGDIIATTDKFETSSKPINTRTRKRRLISPVPSESFKPVEEDTKSKHSERIDEEIAPLKSPGTSPRKGFRKQTIGNDISVPSKGRRERAATRSLQAAAGDTQVLKTNDSQTIPTLLVPQSTASVGQSRRGRARLVEESDASEVSQGVNDSQLVENSQERRSTRKRKKKETFDEIAARKEEELKLKKVIESTSSPASLKKNVAATRVSSGSGQPKRGRMKKEASTSSISLSEELNVSASQTFSTSGNILGRQGNQPSSRATETSQTPSKNNQSQHSSIISGEMRVMFTGLADSKLSSMVRGLGGKVVERPQNCTILVTDKVRRTVKFLCALGLGKPIVTPNWLSKSKAFGAFADPALLLLNDREAEKKFQFELSDSLEKAKNARLLEGYSFYVTPSVLPPPAEMKQIVECSGGVYFAKPPAKWPSNAIIISIVGDKAGWSKLSRHGVLPPILSAEAILSGVLQQKFDVNKYPLK